MVQIRSLLFKAAIICLGVCCVGSAPEAAETKPNVTFAVMSDIHIHKRNVEDHQRLLRALDDYRHIHPHMDLLVINGDLTNGFPSHYDVLRRLLDSVPHPPLHFTPGNHEFYKMHYNQKGEWAFEQLPNGWSSEKALDLFRQFTGYDHPYHDAWINGYHFIFLATEKSRDYDPSIGKNAYLSEAQLDWLRDKLSERPFGMRRPTFVFLHHPLPNTVDGSERETTIIQHQTLRPILEQHPEVIFFSGHTHYNLRKTKQWHVDRFLMLGSSSIKKHEESLYIEVYDDYVDIHSRDHRRREWIMDKSYRYRLKQEGDDR